MNFVRPQECARSRALSSMGEYWFHYWQKKSGVRKKGESFSCWLVPAVLMTSNTDDVVTMTEQRAFEIIRKTEKRVASIKPACDPPLFDSSPGKNPLYAHRLFDVFRYRCFTCVQIREDLFYEMMGIIYGLDRGFK